MSKISTRQKIECLKGWIASNKYLQDQKRKFKIKKKKA